MGACLSHAIHGFDDGLWVDGVWEPLGAQSAGMNLNHWADAAWAEGAMVEAAWGGTAEVAETVQRGGTSKRRKRKYPRRWSDPLVPVQPGIILAETPEVQPEIITVPARPFLSEALQEREARKKRMRKVAAIAAAFLDS